MKPAARAPFRFFPIDRASPIPFSREVYCATQSSEDRPAIQSVLAEEIATPVFESQALDVSAKSPRSSKPA
jgi:hypothetical protein